MGEEEFDFMLNEGSDYISDDDCVNDGKCRECSEIERCYLKATTQINHEFAESCNFGGFDTEKEFWEDLFD